MCPTCGKKVEEDEGVWWVYQEKFYCSQACVPTTMVKPPHFPAYREQ